MKIDDPNETVDQRGLFSVAFPRDYRRSGRFYVQYVDRAGKERVDELRRGRRQVRRVLDLGPVGTQHHGGQLQFGPDGLLYVSTGMDTPVHPGSLLRLDPRRSALPEVYATGLRNPWRFSFDRATGALLIGDVGDKAAEEVDVLAPGAPRAPTSAGRLRGRPRAASPRRPARPAAPALVLQHPDRWCAITGGYVVRDRRLPALAGRYVFAASARAGCGAPRSRAPRWATRARSGCTAPYPVSFRPGRPRPPLRRRTSAAGSSGCVSATASSSPPARATGPPSGGSVTSAENGWPCQGIASASTPPQVADVRCRRSRSSRC